MAKRMSNKERIQRKGLEAAAAAVEKAKKKERPDEAKSASKSAKASGTKAPTTAKERVRASRASAPAASQRLKLVWKVFNASGKEVAVFAYPDKAEADAMAEKLTTKSGQPHFVNGVKVPLEAT